MYCLATTHALYLKYVNVSLKLTIVFFAGDSVKASTSGCEASIEQRYCGRVFDENINTHWMTGGQGVGAWIKVTCT